MLLISEMLNSYSIALTRNKTQLVNGLQAGEHAKLCHEGVDSITFSREQCNEW